MNNNILEKKAVEFRNLAGLSDSDPIRFKSLLTKLNIITILGFIFRFFWYGFENK